MSYSRVVPRDFFNEAKLLKCLGKLSLLILDNELPDYVEILECGEPFDIQYSTMFDGLYVNNYLILINKVPYFFYSKYNSTNNYTLVCVNNQTKEMIDVFSEDGRLEDDFQNFIRNLYIAP